MGSSFGLMPGADRNGPWVAMGNGATPAGWCDYMAFWESAIASAPHGSILVEVGVFCGLSLVQLGALAKAANKGLRVIGVDTFKGSEEHAEFMNDAPKGILIREAWYQLDAAGLLDDVTLLVCDSVKAAELLGFNEDVHAVFLDAAHDKESVLADIEAWRWQVIGDEGMIGGHDYWTFPTVKEAVDEYFGEGVVKVPTEQSWWVRRNGGAA